MSKEKFRTMEYIEKISSPKTLWHCINSELPLEAKPLSAILSILKNKVEQKDTKEDWGDSLYLAENSDVSIGYANADGGKIPYLVKLELVLDLPCVFSDNLVYKGEDYRKSVYTVPTECIKAQVETLFLKPMLATPFMKYLSNHKHAYRCFHDLEGKYEIIVPSSMVSDKFFKVEAIYPLKCDKYGKYSM